jgi:hypothetical protein
VKNDIPSKYSTHQGLTKERIAEIVGEISKETGFVPGEEMHRRFIYDPDKVRRIRINGTFKGTLASLCFQNSKPEVEEELIRQAFRTHAAGLNVRPPHTYAFRPFNDDNGYAWSIDEFVVGRPLFQPEKRPETAARDFLKFYKKLRNTMRIPFWPTADVDAQVFTKAQLGKWVKTAKTIDANRVVYLEPILGMLSDKIVGDMRGHLLSFTHPHLSGGDVLITRRSGYVVFANEFWSWRQPGYALAFPIWTQWLALDERHRTEGNVHDITETWLETIERELVPNVIASTATVKTMLLNRIFGSLILYLPAQHHRHSEASITALEAALIAEAERLMA